MDIEYRIEFENGHVRITQRVDTAASPGSAAAKVPAGTAFTQLSPSLATSRGLAKSTVAQKGGVGNGTGPGHGPPSPGAAQKGGVGNGTGPGHGPPSEGQVVVFGPVVIDATGLIHKSTAEDKPEQKKGNH